MSKSKITIGKEVEKISQTSIYKINFSFYYHHNSVSFSQNIGIICQEDHNFGHNEDKTMFKALCIHSHELYDWDNIKKSLYQIISDIGGSEGTEKDTNMIIEHLIKRCEYVMSINDVEFFDL